MKELDRPLFAEYRRRCFKPAAGLTRYEAEGAFSLSIVRHGRLDPACIWDVKSQQLKKSGLVSIHRGNENFQQLGGLDNLKAFCLPDMQQQSEGTVSNRPHGSYNRKSCSVEGKKKGRVSCCD